MSLTKLNVVQGETCFSAQEKHGVACLRKTCINWISQDKFNNCSILGAQHSPLTLQEIGEAYGLTRMRICQIEKKAIEKIKSNC